MPKARKRKELWVLMLGDDSALPLVACFSETWEKALRKLELDLEEVWEIAIGVKFRARVPTWYFPEGEQAARERDWAGFLEYNREHDIKFYLFQVEYLD